MMLKIPVIGKVLNDRHCRFAQHAGSSDLQAGVPLVEALDSVAGATGSRVYETAAAMKDDVSVGYRSGVHWRRRINLFPHMNGQMTAIGEGRCTGHHAAEGGRVLRGRGQQHRRRAVPA